jgi:hypothetical protein
MAAFSVCGELKVGCVQQTCNTSSSTPAAIGFSSAQFGGWAHGVWRLWALLFAPIWGPARVARWLHAAPLAGQAKAAGVGGGPAIMGVSATEIVQ